MSENKDITPIISAIVGGGFFAIPYMALNVALFPAFCIGAVAFGATNMILGEPKKEKIVYANEDEKRVGEILRLAKKQNDQIHDFKNKVESPELVNNINEIYDTVNKIIEAVRKTPAKLEKTTQFFDYYLPVTLKILSNYDEIENQKLNTADSKKTMNSALETLKKVNQSFKNQLANLYQAEILDTDAELKVFETILKQDGMNDGDFDIKLK